MPLVSISEAIILSGKSRPTIYRMIKEGKLSATVTSDGEKGIDTSELMRVFGTLKPLDNETQKPVSRCYNLTDEKSLIVSMLTEQLERERQRADKAETKCETLEKEILRVKDEMTDLYKRLLPEPEPKKGFFSRLFGR